MAIGPKENIITRNKVLKLRELLVKGAKSLSDEDAFSAPEFYDYWQPDTHYEKTEEQPTIRVRDPEDKLLYKLIPNTHDSQSNWPPRLVPAIWVRIDDPSEEWPEWRQPTGSQDAYAINAKVSHNENHWTSDYDNNVWEPGVYGWTMVS